MYIEDSFISTIVETYYSFKSMFEQYNSNLGGYQFDSIEYIFLIVAFVFLVVLIFKSVISLFRWFFDFLI